jgi:hypothetical protein
MESLSQRIRSFLAATGFDFKGDRSSNLELIRYFQAEYGLEVMGLLEREWLEEQLKYDQSQGFVRQLRDQVSDDRLDDFDGDIASIRTALA